MYITSPFLPTWAGPSKGVADFEASTREIWIVWFADQAIKDIYMMWLVVRQWVSLGTGVKIVLTRSGSRRSDYSCRWSI